MGLCYPKKTKTVDGHSGKKGCKIPQASNEYEPISKCPCVTLPNFLPWSRLLYEGITYACDYRLQKETEHWGDIDENRTSERESFSYGQTSNAMTMPYEIGRCIIDGSPSPQDHASRVIIDASPTIPVDGPKVYSAETSQRVTNLGLVAKKLPIDLEWRFSDWLGYRCVCFSRGDLSCCSIMMSSWLSDCKQQPH